MSKIRKDQAKKGIHPLFFVALLMAIILSVSVVRFLSPSIEKVESARFYGNAEAAYSIIHDDLCSDDARGIIETASPLALEYGINFGAAAVVSRCLEGGDSLWDAVRQLVRDGHEIASHSWAHGSPIDLGWQPEQWSNDTDVILSKAVLQEHLGTPVTWFVFPYDAYNDQRIAEIAAAGYLGARAGKAPYKDRGVNGRLRAFDPLRTNFDIYISKAEQDAIHASTNSYDVSIYPNVGRSVALQHMDAAIAIGGWSVQEIHTVAPASDSVWGSITPEAYRELLAYGAEKRDSGQVWIETPSKVAAYIAVRNGVGKPTLRKGVLTYDHYESQDIYHSDITTIVTTKGNPKALFYTVNGKEHKGEQQGRNTFLLTAPVDASIALRLVK